MTTERLYTTVYLAIIIIFFYLFYQVLSPFLITITWAMVLSITFYPVYKIALKLIKRPWVASLITLIVILVIIIGPFTYLTGALVNEITDIYSSIDEKGFSTIDKIKDNPRIAGILDKLSSYKAFENIDIEESAVQSLKFIGKFVGQNISGIFKNTVFLLFSFLIMCMTIFYFLKDGDELTEYIKARLPFDEEQKNQLEKRVKEMVIAVIYGGLAVGIIQGIIGGVAFHVLGLPAPVLWGSAMAILALIPFFGASLIWGPASLMLVFQGSYAKGIGLFVLGALVISMIDNLLRPMLIGDRTKLHMLMVFFSVLGGISYFGFIGFILGPLIAALCLSLLDIYRPAEKSAKTESDKI